MNQLIPKKLIITAGDSYTDIDSFACGIAYKELCLLKGTDAEAVFTGLFNETVTKSIREIMVDYKTTLEDNPQNYNYTIVDLSEPEHIAGFVPQENIIELYDHHWGVEKYWQEKLGDKAVIKPVGACATLIWQEFWNAKVQEKISKESALLLYTAILSNTLNLNAQITHELDRQAIKELHHYAQLPDKWAETYYEESSAAVLSDPEKAMRNDTKVIQVRGVEYGIIQIELWESEPFINQNRQLIEKVLSSLNTQHTFLTSPNIAHDHNFIITNDELVKKNLSEKIGAEFSEDIGKTKKLWLRKEIIKALT